MYLRFLVIFPLLGFLLACSDPLETELSATSSEELKAELEELEGRLDPERYEQLTKAVATGLMQAGMAESFGGREFGPDSWVAENIDGRTPNAIIQRHQEEERAEAERQLSRLEERIAELSGAIEEREAAKQLLNGIAVDDARYYWRDQEYFSPKPIIAFEITNNTDIPIRRVFMSGVVESPGRTIPWIEGDFNYSFSGGLEPGESKDLALSPNQFGEWAEEETQGRDDLQLTLEVVNFSGPDGETVIPSLPSDPERDLEQLRARYEELKLTFDSISE